MLSSSFCLLTKSVNTSSDKFCSKWNISCSRDFSFSSILFFLKVEYEIDFPLISISRISKNVLQNVNVKLSRCFCSLLLVLFDRAKKLERKRLSLRSWMKRETITQPKEFVVEERRGQMMPTVVCTMYYNQTTGRRDVDPNNER